jgi:transcriptional regulator with XRE-family HTH domain
MAKKPHADTRFAKYLDKRLLELKPKKSQAEIAAEVGFINPNMITMLKTGASKLALDRVPALAKALDCDPAYLLRLALEQAVGNTAAKAISDVLGTPVTANERAWLEEIRDASDHVDPRLTARLRTTLRGMFGK